MSHATTAQLLAGLRARLDVSGRDPNSAWGSPWVIGWVGLILVVLAVNATMIVLAFATNPGLVIDDYYERGRTVERTMTTRRAEAPGWTMSLDTPADVTKGRATTVRFHVVDAVGQPVRPERVTYYAYRPSDASADFSRPMIEEAPGRYAVEVRFAMAGLWDTLVAAETDGQEVVFDQRIGVASR
ncbi:FixH family protein [Halochromatium salexigens]|uniref:Nitrogen fixation protein FixH n=1 Tax=Halochromatium salexigens TaxID=49447 RepID=A0AAJ0XHM9_HALSE|nr:FixH family protein [Halochromatium salexigens]MBK5931815.1 nitrogen fixation protein FixH [Halochromatium salexigens]